MKKLKPVLPRNFVAKHMQQLCDAQIFVDRKKQHKRGYSKHKKAQSNNDWVFLCMILC